MTQPVPIRPTDQRDRERAKAMFLLVALTPNAQTPIPDDLNAVVQRAATVIPGLWADLDDLGRQYLARQAGATFPGHFGLPDWHQMEAPERALLIERLPKLAAWAKNMITGGRHANTHRAVVQAQ